VCVNDKDKSMNVEGREEEWKLKELKAGVAKEKEQVGAASADGSSRRPNRR
jgi:hypothetical protein